MAAIFNIWLQNVKYFENLHLILTFTNFLTGIMLFRSIQALFQLKEL